MATPQVALPLDAVKPTTGKVTLDGLDRDPIDGRALGRGNLLDALVDRLGMAMLLVGMNGLAQL